MALAPPKKRKIIRVIIIIVSLVQALINNDQFGTPQEQCGRLVGHAEYLMDSWDENELNWTSEQWALWALIDAIDEAHAPEVLEMPDTSDYEGWTAELATAIAALEA